MTRIGRTLNRIGNRNKGLLALVAVGLTLMVWMWPQQIQEGIEHAANGGDVFQDLLGGLNLGNLTGNGTTREVQVKYQGGALENLGVVESNVGPGSQFDVTGTAATGSAAKFELVCQTRICGSAQDVFQDPLTYWVVTVPPTKDLTKLTVTAGAAFLEVSF